MEMISNTESLGNIVMSHPQAARVFGRHGLDFCCGGNQPLAEACAEKHLDIATIIAQIQGEQQSEAPMQTLLDKSFRELVSYIVDKHHVYTRSALQDLAPLMQKVVTAHGASHPELIELQGLLEQLRSDMELHLQKEERILFPFVIELDNEHPSPPPFGSVANPIRMMNMEHQTDGAILQQMREVTGGFALPDDACTSYSALYVNLSALVEDLMQHIHIENHLLFPKAIAREWEVREHH